MSGTSLVLRFPLVHEDQDIANIGNTNKHSFEFEIIFGDDILRESFMVE